MSSQTKYDFDYLANLKNILPILQEIATVEDFSWDLYRKILTKYPKKEGGFYTKAELSATYQYLQTINYPDLPRNLDLESKIQMKPMRTQSGVTPVTVLTKPYPCPGTCIFCPNDVRMPKSYLSDEPGAQRAERNNFDPYLQTYSRIQALSAIGHPVDKIELIILGGTWSFYPEDYQIWFIKRCFEAMNDFGENINQTEQIEKKENFRLPEHIHKNSLSKNTIDDEENEMKNLTYNQAILKLAKNHGQKLQNPEETATWQELEKEQKRNESTRCRSVGLVIETRPDKISSEEVIRIRRLGCTKTQIGFQSLNDEVLQKNKRGHDVNATRYAVRLLRQAGFKIHAHWMANLYGSNVENDQLDYQKLFSDGDFCPDELKIYPCSLIETAELVKYYEQGLWKPYTHQELLDVICFVLANTPQYCRLSRIIRDIPSDDIMVGNKLTNFRQIAEMELVKRNIQAKDIRAREIKQEKVSLEDLHLDIIEYETSISKEKFLQFVTKDNKIAGFLRLSLPNDRKHPFIQELDDCAMIREVHVYGKSVEIGSRDHGKAQHLGLGTKLINQAKIICKQENFAKLAVISAIGTREYYQKQGFLNGELYQFWQG